MHFGNFSFGSLRIDGRPFEHDVVIDRGEIRDRNSAMTLDTRHYPLRRTYPGNAVNLSSVPVHMADCR